jgi:2'-5' RNA ligase
VRPGPAFPLAPLVEGLTATVLGTTRVEAITLFESRLSPKGPDHVPLQRTPLVA